MPDVRRMHRFRDHVVAGVNWRPMRFVSEVPSSRLCGLCGMIPKRILLLPCGHVLCQSCHAASSQESGGRCPLDQEPFDEAECSGHDFPARRANVLRVRNSAVVLCGNTPTCVVCDMLPEIVNRATWARSVKCVSEDATTVRTRLEPLAWSADECAIGVRGIIELPALCGDSALSELLEVCHSRLQELSLKIVSLRPDCEGTSTWCAGGQSSCVARLCLCVAEPWRNPP
ncbi:hypothetical protein HPB50_009429 [Hyalomma asiaticum]|uniref:Uncharacterized protein n=1 Tax=Hyalomma asiaticum TaxID=266040 RepID=A0ACB7RN62_HYAAI|nr:hypothetical protein HPB50_009429 [Hyalomma asiaticum]